MYIMKYIGVLSNMFTEVTNNNDKVIVIYHQGNLQNVLIELVCLLSASSVYGIAVMFFMTGQKLIILSHTLATSITLSIHFSAKNMSTSPTCYICKRIWTSVLCLWWVLLRLSPIFLLAYSIHLHLEPQLKHFDNSIRHFFYCANIDHTVLKVCEFRRSKELFGE